MKFFTTSNSKNIIATLRMVKIEKSELTFLVILYFHGQNHLSDEERFQFKLTKHFLFKSKLSL